jgi:hypothetical protein
MVGCVLIYGGDAPLAVTDSRTQPMVSRFQTTDHTAHSLAVGRRAEAPQPGEGDGPVCHHGATPARYTQTRQAVLATAKAD